MAQAHSNAILQMNDITSDIQHSKNNIGQVHVTSGTLPIILKEPTDPDPLNLQALYKSHEQLNRRRPTGPRMLIMNQESQIGKCTSQVLCADTQMSALPTSAVLSTILVEVRSWSAPAAVVLRGSSSEKVGLVTGFELKRLSRYTGLRRKRSLHTLLGGEVNHGLNRYLPETHVPSRQAGQSRVIVDQLRVASRFKLGHDGRNTSKDCCVWGLTPNRHQSILRKDAFSKKMTSRDPEPLSLALVLDTMTQLSCDFVVSFNHARMSILSHGLNLE